MTAHEQVIEDIRLKCLEESKRSIRTQARMLGLTLEEFMEMMLIGYAHSILLHKQGWIENGFPTAADRMDEFLEGLDFWQFIEEDLKGRKMLYLELIPYCYRLKEHIDFGFLYETALKLKIDINQCDGRTGLILAVAEAAPHIHLFDLEFDAFIEKRSVVDGFPAIVFYPVLFGMLDNLINVITKVFFEIRLDNGQPALYETSEEQVTSYAREGSNQDILKTFIDGILGRSGTVATNMASFKELFSIYTTISASATNFVVLHEYGHFFLGHLDSDEQPMQMEFEADLFSITCLIDQAAAKKNAGYNTILGIAIALFSIAIREAVLHIEASSHPSAVARYQAFISGIGDGIEKKAATDYWNKLTLLLNLTLQKYYEVEIQRI